VWVHNIRHDDLRGMAAQRIRRKNERVCAKHFESSQFMNPIKRYVQVFSIQFA
jgi:hypothetical protein